MSRLSDLSVQEIWDSGWNCLGIAKENKLIVYDDARVRRFEGTPNELIKAFMAKCLEIERLEVKISALEKLLENEWFGRPIE